MFCFFNTFLDYNGVIKKMPKPVKNNPINQKKNKNK